jgi:hypothetical protein
MILIDNENRDKARELYHECPARIVHNLHPEEHDLFGLEVGDNPELLVAGSRVHFVLENYALLNGWKIKK